MMANKLYDVLMIIAQIIMPALATFYVTLADIWNLPLAVQVSATIMAVDALLGAVLKVCSIQYNKNK